MQDFADSSAPALMPIFQAAKGETLLLLVHSTPTLLQSMPRPYVTSMMVPLLVRAADQGSRIFDACKANALAVIGHIRAAIEWVPCKARSIFVVGRSIFVVGSS